MRRFDMGGANDCFGSNSAFSLSQHDKSSGEPSKLPRLPTALHETAFPEARLAKAVRRPRQTCWRSSGIRATAGAPMSKSGLICDDPMKSDSLGMPAIELAADNKPAR
ncbi:MAG: hypothetical protein ACJ8GJ_02215, partial [Vitreoscilla sp.]